MSRPSDGTGTEQVSWRPSLLDPRRNRGLGRRVPWTALKRPQVVRRKTITLAREARKKMKEVRRENYYFLKLCLTLTLLLPSPKPGTTSGRFHLCHHSSGCEHSRLQDISQCGTSDGKHGVSPSSIAISPSLSIAISPSSIDVQSSLITMT